MVVVENSVWIVLVIGPTAKVVAQMTMPACFSGMEKSGNLNCGHSYTSDLRKDDLFEP